MKHNKFRYFCIFSIILIFITTILPDEAFARRGGSFGGFRGRSYRTNKSFGGSRNQRTNSRTQNSRMSPKAAKQKYGTPRKTESFSNKDASGMNRNYRMNDYGGYSSGLMRGYLTGSVMSYMHWLPWYGAFWYSQPVYVTNDDGTVDVYPPSFNITRLIVVLIVLFLIFRFVLNLWRTKNHSYSNSTYYQSDSYNNTSSFD